MSTRTVKTTLIAEVGGYVQGINKAAQSTKELGSEAEKLAQKKQAIGDLGRVMMAGGALAAAGVALAVKSFSEFDQKMSNIQAATDETAENMELLGGAAIQAGRDTAFSAGEAADAVTELAKAGVATADILGGALTGALDLAAAGEIGVARAAEIAATAMTQFGLEGSKVPHIADLLSSGANKAQGGVEELSQALNQAGLVSAAAGLSIEETVGSLSAFASAGLLGSDAGTSFKAMLQRLTPISKEAEDEMRELGISAFDAQGQFIGMEKFAGVLRNGLKDLTPEQRAASQAIIFGTDAVRASNVLYEQGAEGIGKWIREVDDSGAAARTAATKLDNLAGDLQILGGSFDTALIQAGGGANDVLRDLVQNTTFLVNSVGELPKPVLDAGLAVGTIAAAIGLAGGAALLAVPKIAEFKAMVSTLGITAKSASLSIGLIGGALGLAAIAVSAFVSEQAAAKSRTDAFADSLNQATGAVTDYTRELVVKRLQEKGAFDDAKKYGIGQKELTDAILEGGDALDAVEEKLAATSEGLTGNQKRAAGLAAQNSATARSVTQVRKELEDAEEALGNASAATEDTEAAVRDFEDAAADAEQAVEDLSAALEGFGKVELDARAAVRDLEAAIDDATAAIVENGKTLDVNTEAGRANEGALDGIARAANEAAAAIYDQTGSVEDAEGALARGREAYVKVAMAAGMSEDAARDLAKQLIATPDAITTQVTLLGVETAKARLAELAAAYRTGGSVSLRAVVEGDNVKRNANGGMYAYANGGFGAGIYSGGTPLYKFAEPETRWEAFISGKPGQESRNREIWKDAGARLGMSTSSSVNVTVSSKGGIDLLKYVDVQVDQGIASADGARRMTITNGKKVL